MKEDLREAAQVKQIEQVEAPRKRGRPPKAPAQGEEALSREGIIARAVELSQQENLTEISIMRLARDFSVTPGLIHYYIGSRDDLISGVVNQYYKDRVSHFVKLTGEWKKDLRAIARQTHGIMLKYPGVATYVNAHNRYRLFQRVQPGEKDYGLEFFNFVSDVFRKGGFPPKKAALAYHLLAQYQLASANIEIGHQSPGEHKEYIRERMRGLAPEQYGGALFIVKDFTELEAGETFEAGLELLLVSFEHLLKDKKKS
jgi:AcrR family transcriptional regulator